MARSHRLALGAPCVDVDCTRRRRGRAGSRDGDLIRLRQDRKRSVGATTSFTSARWRAATQSGFAAIVCGSPTGEITSVAGTVLDLREPVAIGARLRSASQQLANGGGYDVNYVLDNGGRREPGFAARAYDAQSGRVLEIDTTQPGLQFYTGNALQGRVPVKGGVLYRQTDGFALEPEHFPDSPHHPSFPDTLLKPGESFYEVTIWRFETR